MSFEEACVRNRPRILVIDDEPSFVHAIALFLDSQGIQVIEAANGREGIGRHQREAADVAIVDVHLSDMSGIEVAAAISDGERAPPIIMISSDDSPETVRASARAGAWSFLAKPLAPQELLNEIYRALNRRPSVAT